MSSLIVVEVALDQEDGSSGQSYAWIEKRIQDVFSNSTRRYDSLVEKTERITKLHTELTGQAEIILKKDNPAWKIPDAARKVMESFFRKADRFRIVLIQLLLEENEMRLLEEFYLNEIQRYLSSLTEQGLMNQDNPAWKNVSDALQEISVLKLQSDRIARYKKLISDVASLYYTFRQSSASLLKRIAEVKKEVATLELQNISLQDLEMIHTFQSRLADIAAITDITLKETKLMEIENEISAFSHRLSGIEHIDTSGSARSGISAGADTTQVTQETSQALLALEADFFHGRIRFFDYDNTEGDDYGPISKDITPGRLALQRDNLQLEYGLLKEKLPEKTVIREELEEMVQNLSIEPDAGALLDAAMLLYHDPFPELRELMVIRRQYDAYFLQKKRKSLSDDQWTAVVNKLLEKMQSRGYRIKARRIPLLRDTFRRSNLEIFTPVSHYSLMLSLNPLDELVLRLVRIINGLDIEELDQDLIRVEDGKASSVWSRDFNIMRDELREEKIQFIERLRKNPDEIPIQQLTRFDLLTDEHIS